MDEKSSAPRIALWILFAIAISFILYVDFVRPDCPMPAYTGGSLLIGCELR